ncbi:ABC transporter permease [Lactococcus ileimucosae]|uniref:ABC transporter permease n=1 Tax=Lactococcus ileimucosae TaxID=2941329 RepID=UPI003515ADC6
MYLAIKEIFQNKLRYSLIVTTVFLIAYMVFFMTSLALGLVRDNRTAADHWNSTGVVLSDYANSNLTASFIPENSYTGKLTEDAAALGYMFAVTNLKGDTEKVNVSLFAQDWDSFIAPELSEGSYPTSDDEVVIDESMKNYGITLGDTVQLNGSSTTYTVVGLTKDNKFFTVPVVYTNLKTYWTLQGTLDSSRSISAIVLKNEKQVTADGLTQISENKMIAHIPGYTAEVNVFMGMIIAMIVITSMIVGIFIYIITIQKLGLYGVMRAQGIQVKTIVWSLFCQIFILSIIGIALALLGIWAVKFVLPATLFFYPSWPAYAGLSVGILFMALLGGMISLPRLLKVDPITAIAE